MPIELFRKCERCGGTGQHAGASGGFVKRGKPACDDCYGVGYVPVEIAESVEALVCEVRQGNIGEWHTSCFELSIDKAAAKIAVFVDAEVQKIEKEVPLNDDEHKTLADLVDETTRLREALGEIAGAKLIPDSPGYYEIPGIPNHSFSWGALGPKYKEIAQAALEEKPCDM